MGLPDLSGLFQYQINYFFVIPFSGACSNPSGLSNYFTRPVYSYIKSFYLPYSPHPPPFFLWLILLIPGLYGLRQININYTRLILYSRLIQCMFTKLSMLLSSPFQVLLRPIWSIISKLFILLPPFPGAAQTCLVYSFPIYLYFLAPLSKCSHAWSFYSLLKYSYFLASLSR